MANDDDNASEISYLSDLIRHDELIIKPFHSSFDHRDAVECGKIVSRLNKPLFDYQIGDRKNQSIIQSFVYRRIILFKPGTKVILLQFDFNWFPLFFTICPKREIRLVNGLKSIGFIRQGFALRKVCFDIYDEEREHALSLILRKSFLRRKIQHRISNVQIFAKDRRQLLGQISPYSSHFECTDYRPATVMKIPMDLKLEMKMSLLIVALFLLSNKRREQGRSLCIRATDFFNAYLIFSARRLAMAILGAKLFEEQRRIIYAVIDQPNLICIQHKDHDESADPISLFSTGRRASVDNSLRSHTQSMRRSFAEFPGQGTLITSISNSVYDILRLASIPTFFVASHPQSDMFIGQKCNIIPFFWNIRRCADANYIKNHPNISFGHRFIPVSVEIVSRSCRSISSDEIEQEEVIYSYDQFLQTNFDLDSMRISSTEIEFMYEISLTVFDILEHLWMTRMKSQLTYLQLQFGLTFATKELVLVNMFDIDTWHFARPSSSEEETLRWINWSLKEILDLNLNHEETEVDPFPSIQSRCIIVCASFHELESGQKLKNNLNEVYHIQSEIRLCSLYQSPQNMWKFISNYSFEHCRPTVVVTLGSMNNGLAMCLTSNSQYPIIHCLCFDNDQTASHLFDFQSFLSMDTSSFTLALTIASAVQSVVQILAMQDWRLWVKQRGRRLKKLMELILADQQLINTQSNKAPTTFSALSK